MEPIRKEEELIESKANTCSILELKGIIERVIINDLTTMRIPHPRVWELLGFLSNLKNDNQVLVKIIMSWQEHWNRA